MISEPAVRSSKNPFPVVVRGRGLGIPGTRESIPAGAVVNQQGTSPHNGSTQTVRSADVTLTPPEVTITRRTKLL